MKILNDFVINMLSDGKIEEVIRLGCDPLTGVVEELIQSLTVTDIDLKRAVATALAEIAKKDPVTFDKLIRELTSNEDSVVQLGCSYSLGLIKGEKVAEALPILFSLKEVADPEALLSEIAKADANTLEIIIKVLSDGDINLFMKKRCASVLGMVGDISAADVLIKRIGDMLYSDFNTICVSSLLNIIKSNDVNKPENELHELKIRIVEALRIELRHFFMAMIPHPRTFMHESANLLTELGKKDETVFYILLKELALAEEYPTVLNKVCADALKEINNPRGLHFKRIIYDKDEAYAMEIGLENTLKTITEYLELIKDYYSKDEIKQIKSNLIIFYRQVADKINESKGKMNLDLPNKIRQPKGIGTHKRMERAVR